MAVCGAHVTTAVEFKNVSKHYPHYGAFSGGLKNFLFNLRSNVKGIRARQFQALIDISFQIQHGESVAIMGRNGSGKSTTLGMIAGVLRPNAGSVAVQGRVSPLLELGGGFHPDLSGLENIRLNGVLLGLSRKQVEQKLEQIIDFSELGEFIDQPVRTYSSGMTARLGFSVVAHLDPEILLIDEVLAVGDLAFQRKCQQKMHEFKKSGITIVLVTHNPGDVEALCERAIWIDNHRIRIDGPTSEVLPEYTKALG